MTIRRSLIKNQQWMMCVGVSAISRLIAFSLYTHLAHWRTFLFNQRLRSYWECSVFTESVTTCLSNDIFLYVRRVQFREKSLMKPFDTRITFWVISCLLCKCAFFIPVYIRYISFINTLNFIMSKAHFHGNQLLYWRNVSNYCHEN